MENGYYVLIGTMPFLKPWNNGYMGLLVHDRSRNLLCVYRAMHIASVIGI